VHFKKLDIGRLFIQRYKGSYLIRFYSMGILRSVSRRISRWWCGRW